jgi:hypothetical protein
MFSSSVLLLGESTVISLHWQTVAGCRRAVSLAGPVPLATKFYKSTNHY